MATPADLVPQSPTYEDLAPPAEPAGSPTSLVPLGTNRHPPSSVPASQPQWLVDQAIDQDPLAMQSVMQRRLHHRHRHARRRIIEALAFSDDPQLTRKAVKMAECCRAPLIVVNTDGSPGSVLGCCKDRLCPHCQKSRAARMHTRVLELVRRMNSRRFMTLTLAHSDAPLDAQLDRLLSSFRQLRRLAVWRRYVAGGVWVIEITFNPVENRWHPHLHIICDGGYFPHAELKAAWLQITGDSSIVDIRRCDDARDAAHYVAAYVGKLDGLANVPTASIVEYALALHRRRLSGTFGTSHAHVLQARHDADEVKPAEPLISAWRLSQAALSGDDDAAYAVAVLCSISRRWCVIFGETPPPAGAALLTPRRQELDRVIRICRRIKDSDDGQEEENRPHPPPNHAPALPY